MLVASLLWYKKFTEDLKGAGFVFNPYDPCVANKMYNGRQLTTAIHVDDNKVSCEDPKALERPVIRQGVGQLIREECLELLGQARIVGADRE